MNSEFLNQVLNRLKALVLKLTGFEGLIWITATVAFFKGILPPDPWILLSLGASGIKTFQHYKDAAATVKENKDVKP